MKKIFTIFVMMLLVSITACSTDDAAFNSDFDGDSTEFVARDGDSTDTRDPLPTKETIVMDTDTGDRSTYCTHNMPAGKLCGWCDVDDEPIEEERLKACDDHAVCPSMCTGTLSPCPVVPNGDGSSTTMHRPGCEHTTISTGRNSSDDMRQFLEEVTALHETRELNASSQRTSKKNNIVQRENSEEPLCQRDVTSSNGLGTYTQTVVYTGGCYKITTYYHDSGNLYEEPCMSYASAQATCLTMWIFD